MGAVGPLPWLLRKCKAPDTSQPEIQDPGLPLSTDMKLSGCMKVTTAAKGVALTLLAVALGAGLQAQNTREQSDNYNRLQKQEQQLQRIGDSMVDGQRQATRVKSLKQYIPALIEALKIPGSFDYPFDSVRYMFTFTPPDKRFRLYNWHVDFTDNTFRYYGVIQMRNPDSLELYPLYDRVEDALLNAQDTVLGREGWYGAQYFKLIQQTINDKKYYTLLGWDGFNNTSNRKLIDVLSFDKGGKPRFGAPIFRKDDQTMKRVIWKYNNNATMQVEYDAEERVIAFDHLVPPDQDKSGREHTYVPDGTYDYYKFKPEEAVWEFKKQYFPEDFSPAQDSENTNQDDS